jgi:hypothetical protein
MRWRPVILDLALVVAVWTVVLWLVRVRQKRIGDLPSPRALRAYRVQTVAAISATVGFTWFVVWLVSDTIGPHWLHALSLPAAAIFIAVGAILSGYAGWVGGPD